MIEKKEKYGNIILTNMHILSKRRRIETKAA